MCWYYINTELIGIIGHFWNQLITKTSIAQVWVTKLMTVKPVGPWSKVTWCIWFLNTLIQMALYPKKRLLSLYLHEIHIHVFLTSCDIRAMSLSFYLTYRNHISCASKYPANISNSMHTRLLLLSVSTQTTNGPARLFFCTVVCKSRSDRSRKQRVPWALSGRPDVPWLVTKTGEHESFCDVCCLNAVMRFLIGRGELD